MCPKSKEDCELIRQNTIGRLLKAAMQEFAVHGYHAASMAKIARRANVSKGLAYHYFESKEELLVMLAQQRLEEWQPLIHGLETIQNPMERFEFLIDFVLQELEKKTRKLRFFLTLYLTADGVRAIEKAMKTDTASFERIFSAEKRLFTELGFSDPDLEAVFFRSTLQGISLEYMLGPKNYPLQQMKERLISRYKIKRKDLP